MADRSDEELQEMESLKETFIQRWGALITGSGGKTCRGGAYSYPGALDRYEKALGLKPAEAWLMKRLLAHDWDGKGYVWLSLRKISEEADVSYGELLELKKELELKGYIRDMGQHGSGAFSQVRDWSIKGFLVALERAIKCDPANEHSQALAKIHGHPITMADFWVHANGPKKGKPYTPYLSFTTPKQVNEYENKHGCIVGWDPHYNGDVNIPQPQKRQQRERPCPECGKPFKTGSRNPKTRCLICRKAAKLQSLNTVITA